MSKYGVISGPYFLAFGLTTKRYSVSLRIQSKCGKIRTRNNSVFGHFSHSVGVTFCFKYEHWNVSISASKSFQNRAQSRYVPWNLVMTNFGNFALVASSFVFNLSSSVLPVFFILVPAFYASGILFFQSAFLCLFCILSSSSFFSLSIL